MLLQEDGIWVTEPERYYLLKFGFTSPGQNERAIFEAALPGALKLSDTFTDTDLTISDNPLFGPGDPTDRLSLVARAELQAAGIHFPEIVDLDIPEDTEPVDTENRFRIPVKLAPALVRLFANEYLWHTTMDENDQNATLARENGQKLLSIIPPTLREKLFGSLVIDVEDLELS